MVGIDATSADMGLSVTHDFPTTSWAKVYLAGAEGDDAGRPALTALVQRYAPVLEAHVVRHHRKSEQVAEDIVQGFITDRILGRALMREANHERGRFRTFLLTALQNYMIDLHRRETTKRRSPGQLPVPLEVAAPSIPPAADIFDVEWAKHVVREALARTQAQSSAVAWTVFEKRVVRPALHGEAPVDYQQLQQTLGLQTYAQVTALVSRTRKVYREALRTMVAEYVADTSEIDEEIAFLRRILQDSVR